VAAKKQPEVKPQRPTEESKVASPATSASTKLKPESEDPTKATAPKTRTEANQQKATKPLASPQAADTRPAHEEAQKTGDVAAKKQPEVKPQRPTEESKVASPATSASTKLKPESEDPTKATAPKTRTEANQQKSTKPLASPQAADTRPAHEEAQKTGDVAAKKQPEVKPQRKQSTKLESKSEEPTKAASTGMTSASNRPRRKAGNTKVAPQAGDQDQSRSKKSAMKGSKLGSKVTAVETSLMSAHSALSVLDNAAAVQMRDTVHHEEIVVRAERSELKSAKQIDSLLKQTRTKLKPYSTSSKNAQIGEGSDTKPGKKGSRFSAAAQLVATTPSETKETKKTNKIFAAARSSALLLKKVASLAKNDASIASKETTTAKKQGFRPEAKHLVASLSAQEKLDAPLVSKLSGQAKRIVRVDKTTKVQHALKGLKIAASSEAGDLQQAKQELKLTSDESKTQHEVFDETQALSKQATKLVKWVNKGIGAAEQHHELGESSESQQCSRLATAEAKMACYKQMARDRLHKANSIAEHTTEGSLGESVESTNCAGLSTPKEQTACYKQQARARLQKATVLVHAKQESSVTARVDKTAELVQSKKAQQHAAEKQSEVAQRQQALNNAKVLRHDTEKMLKEDRSIEQALIKNIREGPRR